MIAAAIICAAVILGVFIEHGCLEIARTMANIYNAYLRTNGEEK